MMRILSVLLVYLFSLPVLAKERLWEGLYQGTIGTAKVTVLLSHNEGLGEDSRYSYAGKPYDLGLTLEQERSALVFIESRKLGASTDDLIGKGKSLITGRWRLRLNATAITGTWNDPSGKKTLPIALALVSKPTTEKQKIWIGEAYNIFWSKDLRFVPTKDQKKFGAITIGMSKDALFNLAYPRLVHYPDAERMAKINALLETEHRIAVASARQCQEYLPRQRPGDIKSGKVEAAENVFQVVYANPHLLSLIESGSIFCGGAHPR
jgi:hypothetical protein